MNTAIYTNALDMGEKKRERVHVFNVTEKNRIENCYVCMLSRGRFTFENVTRIMIVLLVNP